MAQKRLVGDIEICKKSTLSCRLIGDFVICKRAHRHAILSFCAGLWAIFWSAAASCPTRDPSTRTSASCLTRTGWRSWRIARFLCPPNSTPWTCWLTPPLYVKKGTVTGQNELRSPPKEGRAQTQPVNTTVSAVCIVKSNWVTNYPPPLYVKKVNGCWSERISVKRRTVKVPTKGRQGTDTAHKHSCFSSLYSKIQLSY